MMEHFKHLKIMNKISFLEPQTNSIELSFTLTISNYNKDTKLSQIRKDILLAANNFIFHYTNDNSKTVFRESEENFVIQDIYQKILPPTPKVWFPKKQNLDILMNKNTRVVKKQQEPKSNIN